MDIKVATLLGSWTFDYVVEHIEDNDEFYDEYIIRFPDFTEDAMMGDRTFCREAEDIKQFARDWLALVIYSYIVDGYGDELPIPKFHGEHSVTINFRDFLEIKEADEIEIEEDDYDEYDAEYYEGG